MAPPLLGPHPTDDGRFIFLYTPPTLFNYLIRGEPFLGGNVSPLLRSISIRLSYGVPLAALAAGPVLLWLTRLEGSPEARRAARTSVVFALLLFLGIFPSAIWSHLAFVVPPALLLITFVGDRCEGFLAQRMPKLSWGPRAIPAVVLLVCAAVSLHVTADLRRWYAEPLGLPRATVRVSEDQAALLRDAHAFIEDCAGPDEAIFVAPDIPILYVLSRRPNPTPHDLIIPGDVDAALIIESLEADRTRCVVYNPRMYPEFPPFETLFPELARYLGANYTRSRQIRGEATVWLGLVREQAGP